MPPTSRSRQRSGKTTRSKVQETAKVSKRVTRSSKEDAAMDIDAASPAQVASSAQRSLPGQGEVDSALESSEINWRPGDIVTDTDEDDAPLVKPKRAPTKRKATKSRAGDKRKRAAVTRQKSIKAAAADVEGESSDDEMQCDRDETPPSGSKVSPTRRAKVSARLSLSKNNESDSAFESSGDDWKPTAAMEESSSSSGSDFEDVAASQKVRESRLEEVKRRAEDEAKAVKKRKAEIKKKRRSSVAPAESSVESSVAQAEASETKGEQEDVKAEGKEGEKPKPKKKKKKSKETAAERVRRLHPEIQDVWQSLNDVIASQSGEAPKADQPAGLKLSLLPFQREGLSWMIRQETESDFHGGILADEMGMGKTIQTIALLLSRPSDKPTLIVAPTVAIMQWKSEIDKHTDDGLLETLVYHGSARDRNAENLQSKGVVMTSYSTLESEFRRANTGFTRKGVKMKEPSTLQSIEWNRVVLDEAHNIKDRSSSTARAAFALEAKYKWSLSGTPLQNRVGELYSLVKFLKADPYSYYFCKQCDCKSLTWMFKGTRTCECCGHKSYSHFCWWNREILRPIQKFGPQGAGLEAFNKLRSLLKCMMLRRTKVERGSELGLPPRIVYTRRDLFNEEEDDFYEALYSETRTRFEGYVQQGTVLNHYAHIFELLMRMRQAVNHPWLVTLKSADTKEVDVCGICHEEAEDAIQSSCGHIFCREDIRLYLSSCSAAANSCPVCYKPLTVDLTQPTLAPKRPANARKRESIVRRLDLEAWRSSTKIEALLEELEALKAEDATIKSIVFSQFTRFLDLLDWRLQRAGIRCVKLDGRMSPDQRAKVIDAFTNNHHITVFLISLKAGGVALNLTAASRVFLTDPWWNPAVEVQAMDRIHRLGQHRPVIVKRLIVENSIESRIDQLQEKKNLLFQSTVGQDQSALNRLDEDDLKFLFVL